MKVHDMPQYSDEWWALRKGRLTASQAAKLVTPTGRESAQWKGEIGRIIAEAEGWQEPEDRVETEWMARGSDLEDEARKWFTVDTGLPVHPVGFVTDESGCLGASPDGIVYSDEFLPDFIPLELKVPKTSTHIQWLLDGVLPPQHAAQVHFQMALLGSPVAYFMSYSPHCEPLIIKVERDKMTEMMEVMFEKYIDAFQSAYNRITGHDYEAMQEVQSSDPDQPGNEASDQDVL